MDSSNEEFDYNELDEFMFKELIDSLDSDIDDDKDADMMVSIQEETEKKEEHILNFKGSIKCRILCSPMHNCMTALRMLAYDTTEDVVNEIVRMGKSTCIDAK